MADQSITQLPIAYNLTGNEQIPVVQGGVTKQATVSQIANAASPGKLITNITYTPSNGDLTIYYSDGTLQTIGPISGYSGYSGISGFSGYSGYSGAFGFSGVSGYSGKSGYSGYSGSGISGFSGVSGYSGFSGAKCEIFGVQKHGICAKFHFFQSNFW